MTTDKLQTGGVHERPQGSAAGSSVTGERLYAYDEDFARDLKARAVKGVAWSAESFLAAAVEQASWHTFPCERLRGYMSRYMPSRMSSRGSVIPHIALRQLRFEPRPRRRERSFIMSHVGRLVWPRRPDVLLGGVRRFLNGSEGEVSLEARFCGTHSQDVLGVARRLGVEKVVSVEPPKPYEKALETLSGSDVVVLVEAECAEGIFLPSKFVDYVQTGRPILALSPRVGTVADIISEHGGGIAVDGRSPRAVADAIATMYAHWQAGTLDATYGSSHLFGLFGEEVVWGRYLELFGRIRAEKEGQSIGASGRGEGAGHD